MSSWATSSAGAAVVGRASGRRRWFAWRVAACAVVIPLLAGCERQESILERGDRLWADSSYEKALAEYRLAQVREPRGGAAQLRVAHAYARLGKLDEAVSSYAEALQRSPESADQAVFDYLMLARRALARGDRHDVARGVEAALALQPALPLSEFAPVLARYYSETGELERALLLYQRALTTAPPDSIPGLLFQLGSIYAGRGNCREALGYFTAARSRSRVRARVEEATWWLGNCAFELARRARDEGRVTEALEHLELMLGLGVPSHLLDQAWFERGEVLFTLGRFEPALESYRKVVELNRSRGGLLVEKARERIDQIRFGT